MGEVGTLCSGLPGCCWGRGQGGRGSGWGGGGRGNPPCAGSTGGNGVCMPGPPGDWWWAESGERVRGDGQSAPFDHYCTTSVLLGICYMKTRE